MRTIASHSTVSSTIGNAPARLAEPEPIAVIPKNKRERIHIRLKRYNDLDLVDARVYVDDGTQFLPTKKGICLHVNTLTLLIEGVQKAEAEARRLGQITDRMDRKAAA